MSLKVCGIGVVSAIGVGVEENLKSLLEYRCGIGCNTLFDTSVDVPVARVTLSNEELRESLGIGNIHHISRTSLLGALAAREALSGITIRGRLGFVNSTSIGGMDLSEEFYRSYISDPSKGRLRDIVGHDCATSTDFIAKYCNIEGFRTTISTACSSAANAVIMGAMMLERDMLDYVLVGGTDALCRFTICGFNSLMILDSELCRPFDNNRKGLNLGEGAAYILLTKDEDPEAICNLVGYANANDAHHQTASSAEGEGAYLAMRKAMQMAELNSYEIDYINLHGTGTENNDLSETEAIKKLFGEVPPCSSTKGYTGHTLAAAGALEAVYSILSISNKCRYANLRFDTKIENGITPIQYSEERVEVTNVLSNSFGFGGNCSTLIFSSI